MKVEIKCPVCKARNTLTKEKSACRRCKEDLTLLYAVKMHSYQYRLQLLRIILSRSEYAESFAVEARFLVKEK